jgi:hypothetical protein
VRSPRAFPREKCNILRRYSLYDKDIGYCQGMNFIVAGIIMHQRRPELTFWILERIMMHYRLGMRRPNVRRHTILACIHVCAQAPGSSHPTQTSPSRYFAYPQSSRRFNQNWPLTTKGTA